MGAGNILLNHVTELNLVESFVFKSVLHTVPATDSAGSLLLACRLTIPMTDVF